MASVIAHHTGNKKVAVVSTPVKERDHLRIPGVPSSLTHGNISTFTKVFDDKNPAIINRVYIRNQFENLNAQFILIPLCQLFSVCEYIKIFVDDILVREVTDKMGKHYYHRHYLQYENEIAFLSDRPGHAARYSAPTLQSNEIIYLQDPVTTEYSINDLDYVFGDFFRGLDTRYLKKFRVEIKMIASTSRTQDSFFVGLEEPGTVNLSNLTIKNLSLDFDLSYHPVNSSYFLGNKISIPSFELHRKQYVIGSQAETLLSFSLFQDFPKYKSINAIYFYLSQSVPASLGGNYTIFENNNIIKSFELNHNSKSQLLLESPTEIQAYIRQYFKQKNNNRTETNQNNTNANRYTMGLMIPLHNDSSKTGQGAEHFSMLSNLTDEYSLDLTVSSVGHAADFNILNVVIECGTIINLSHAKGFESIIQ